MATSTMMCRDQTSFARMSHKHVPFKSISFPFIHIIVHDTAAIKDADLHVSCALYIVINYPRDLR